MTEMTDPTTLTPGDPLFDPRDRRRRRLLSAGAVGLGVAGMLLGGLVIIKDQDDKYFAIGAAAWWLGGSQAFEVWRPEDGREDLEGFAWVGSLHETADMTCQDCHESHSNERAMRDPELQRDNCSGCHRRQIARHPRFEGRGIEFDETKCSACHWVHELEPEE